MAGRCKLLLIGLMSGTSADGIDAALVEIEGEGRSTRVSLRRFLCVPHPESMREAILRACSEEGAASPDICALNFALGESFADAAIQAAAAAGVELSAIDAIASHGQTIWHQPEPVEIAGRSLRGTLQLGEPAVIAARTGCQVVSGFRTADMAAGGQGAPLVPFFDWAVLTSDTESRAILNIGGIANVTHLPRGATIHEVLAFDTGPGNMVSDELAYRYSMGEKRFDENGDWATRGTPNLRIAESFLELHPFFEQPPPKSTGREVFGNRFVDGLMAVRERGKGSAANMIATAVYITAKSIADAFETWLVPRGGVDTVIVGGGGTHNKTLMENLKELLAPVRITTHEEFGIPNDAKEAMAFALLAYETLHGRPSNVPSATGASRRVILGSITPKQG